MRFLFFLFFTVYAFSYELYVYKKSDYLTLKNIGIVCQKTLKGYLCAKSDNFEKLKKIQNYVTHFGVSANIVSEKKIKTDIPQNGYCIQVLSSKKLSDLETTFNNLSNFPYTRIEKIGKYFVIRVAQEKNYKNLQNILKKIKKEYHSAFIRKCDYIPQRIKKNNFLLSNRFVTLKEKKEDFSGLKNEEKLSLLKKYYYEEQYEKALVLAKDLKKGFYKKKALKYMGKIYYKMKKYEKACRLLKNLNAIYKQEDIEEYKKKACYEYFLNEASNNIYLSPFAALSWLEKAEKLQRDRRYYKYLGLSYVSIREYEKAYSVLKKLYLENPEDKDVYLNYAKVLFALKKFKELDKIANENYSFFKNYKLYKTAEKLCAEGQYEKAYKIAKKIWKIYPKNKNINLLMVKIFNKQKRSDYAFIYLNKVLKIYGEDIETLKMMRNIYFNQQDFVNAYNTAEKLKKEYNITDNINNKIFQEFYLFKSFQSYESGDFNKSLNYIATAENFVKNIDIFDMRGEVYLAMKKYEDAYKNYYNAFLIKPARRFQKKLIFILFKLNQPEKAENFAFSSNDPIIKDFYYIQKAYRYIEKKDYIKANVALKKVENKNSTEFYKIKGIVCYYLNNLECALKFLNNSFKDIEVDYYLIKIYLKLKKNEKAKKILKSFPKIYNPEWKSKLMNIYIQLGDIKKAKEILGD